MKKITIAADLLTIDTDSFSAGNYVAIANGSNVAIVHSGNSKDRIFDSAFNQVKLNNVLYGSAKLFCSAFNALAAAAIKTSVGEIKTGVETMGEDLKDLKDNTGYPENLISAVLTPNNATQITNQALSGSVMITNPSTNTKSIFVGAAGVDNTKYALEPDKSIVIELSDLSRIYVKNDAAGEKVHVIGSYKSA